ncbi:N-acetylmuramoyl-L-alanine amidase [Thermodesulfovibrio sp. 3907-1M]|uniref:N-acetylmuramoyl-L-alanine amidase n=1 Tax=Thermodesulfovibrio autotrophicus TaxID=3118333 RepID=A0AAU8GVW2_9BACT
MIKKTVIFIIFFILSTAFAQEDTHKIVLKYGKHQDFYRFVLVCEKPEITYSINVNLLNDGKIKLSFTAPFDIEFEGKILSQQDKIKDLKIFKNEGSFIIGTSNISKIKVSRYESPSRLVIDAFLGEPSEEEKIKSASILIDPGHGGQDSGIKEKNSSEKELVLYISKEIASRLAQKGIKAFLTRATDEDISLKKRLKIQNALKPALFLSVHLSSRDFFVIYTSAKKINISKDDPSKIFLKEDSLVQTFVKKIKEKFSEPVYTEKLPATLLKEASAPALMIEVPKRALFSDKSYVNKVVDVLVQGTLENFKIKLQKTNDE